MDFQPHIKTISVSKRSPFLWERVHGKDPIVKREDPHPKGRIHAQKGGSTPIREDLHQKEQDIISSVLQCEKDPFSGIFSH